MDRQAHAGGSDLFLLDYLREWVDTYQGTGKTGFREETRSEYRSVIERRMAPHFGSRKKLTALTARDVARYITFLTRESNGRGGTLSDSSVQNNLNPLRAAMSSARAQGLIVLDPTQAAQLPHRPTVETHEDDVRPLSREQLYAVIMAAPQVWHLRLWVLAMSGLRASEFIGLDVSHLQDDGLLVRQRFRNGTMGPVKSKHARRKVPLAPDLVDRIRAQGLGMPKDPLFPNNSRGRLDLNNTRNRVIAPAAARVGLDWVGWHTFRHTHASLRFDAGNSVVTIQRVLGHHSPSFTLDTYVHLLEGNDPQPLAL